jgi:hypothetical protein
MDFPSFLMTGKVSPTTAVRTRISGTTDATVLPFAIPHDEHHFTKEEVKRATLAVDHFTTSSDILMAVPSN